ncbi:unnamed protein product [Rodentolepis nana]|uniref:Uncharacterized protein n=1 Tax=Rodentolepis nana TaxID=102285 RepID=A0A0R3TVV8_RODNA|nr:unnamed protein product [Rodentolepis nana]
MHGPPDVFPHNEGLNQERILDLKVQRTQNSNKGETVDSGGNGEDPPDVKPTGGNGEDPSDSLQEKMEKTHLIRCSKEEMEKTHLIRCLAINPHALYVTYRRKSGEAPSQIRRGNGEDLPDSVSGPEDNIGKPEILVSKKTAN